MTWRNVKLIFSREVVDQLRDRRTLFMVLVLPLLLYPALGIGTLHMSSWFTDQTRTVVILGADSLPKPDLLNVEGTRILDRWFVNEGDSTKLDIISDRKSDAPQEEKTEESNTTEKEIAEQRRNVLQIAQLIAVQMEELKKLKEEYAAAQDEDQTDRAKTKQQQIQALIDEISHYFSEANIQVLILIPEGFDEQVKEQNENLAERDAAGLSSDRVQPTVIRNSANDKSLIAYGRVREAMDSWERALLQERLEMANLPQDLTQPVNEERIDLAKGEELAANMWSKLFPTMLILMAMMGAFYPAVDLGAGEKERGTMETLLISPATRPEIVIGKFLTVLVFSLVTALLNLVSMGATGTYVLNTAASGQLDALGDLSIPDPGTLCWLGLLAIPLAALFASLSLAFALFAKSTKEGHYYLTPLLTVTMGMTVFCLSPAVEITSFFSVMPVMGPALLLKGLLLETNNISNLMWYVPPVLISSFAYCGLALYWAIDQFQREEVLFREAERFDFKLWLRHLLRDKESLPNFSEAVFCFTLIMMMQFGMLSTFSSVLRNAEAGTEANVMVQLLLVQQLAVIACPALFMGILLTSSPIKTFQFRLPKLSMLGIGLLLPLLLHPLVVELATRLAWFFPSLPEHAKAALATMADGSVPWWWTLIAFAVAPAICEEIVFRGFLLAGFRRTGRNRLAVVLSAILFGVMHMIPQQVFNASLLGLVLGALAIKSGSLIPCIAFHFVNNALGVVHGNLGAMREQSGLVRSLTVQTELGIQYSLFILIIATLLAIPLLWILFRSPTIPPTGPVEHREVESHSKA